MQEKYSSINVNSADNLAINNIVEEMNRRTKHTSTAFGEGRILSTNADIKKSLLNTIAEITFGADVKKAAGEASPMSNRGINNSYRKSFIEGLKKEYKARGESLLTGMGEGYAIPSQQMSLYGSHLPTTSQLMLVSLIPSVIKPIHNKVVKSIVTKGLDIERTSIHPYVYDEQGRPYDFFELINSKNKLIELASGGQPLVKVVVPLENKSSDAAGQPQNICALYNKAAQAKDPNFRAITEISDFIARGVKLKSIFVGGNNPEHEVIVDVVSTGDPTQSGQLNTVVATFDTRFTNPVDGKVIAVLGSVDATGTVLFTTNSDDLKAITLEFFIPAKGAQQPVKVVDRLTKHKAVIKRKFSASTTLNEQFLADVQLVLNKDVVSRFNETSVQLVNSKKDQELISFLEDHVNKMSTLSATKGTKYTNLESAEGMNSEYAYALADMTIANPGYTDVLKGGNVILAQNFFKVANKLDRKLNPEKKEFSIISSSEASQWLKNPDGTDVIQLNVTGDAGSEGIAGISTPYVLQRVNISQTYSAKYITTNRIESKDVKAKVASTAGQTVDTFTRKHRWTMIPDFEENLDSVLFLHGLERVTEGVNDIEFNKDKTLQYETRYDIITYNNSIGVVDMIELPTASHEMK